MTTTSAEEMRKALLAGAFQMPSVQTMVSRKSSVTNAFVNAVIPVVPPTLEEIEEALGILKIDPDDVRCVYCGDKASEWDHLRPLVLNRRPTGYISEIGNLVPACGKCNQSKGNKPWRTWMLSKAKLSPAGRGIANLESRVAKIEAFENWRPSSKIDFVAILGQAEWDQYWKLCEDVIAEMAEAQQVADKLKDRIVAAVKGKKASGA
ncbi:MAG: HNH endonuclease [Planctomycetota bacterium]|nr:HNH endonuclease [Planctomycetota bacterium]